MRQKTAVFLLLAVTGLLAVGVGLSLQLLRAGVEASRAATEERLRAVGLTTAHAISLHAGDAGEALLRLVRRDNQLEDAYLLDPSLRPLFSARPRTAGEALSLLRIDPDRALLALHGQPSVGPAYRLDAPDGDGPEEQAVLAGYFPVPIEGSTRLLVLEVGAAFVAAPQRLRTAAWGACALAGALALLFVVAVGAALRAAARERRLYGQAERGRAITQMAAMVAHEIRNPLGTIRAGAELLREQRTDTELCTDILQEVDRLGALTTEFLTLSRDPPLQVEAVDLARLCDEVCEGLRRRTPDGDLALERLGEKSAPILGDPAKLRQVLLNLGLNAIQAMPGGGRLEMTVSRRRGGAEVLITDDGPGIEEQLSHRLFEPFATTKAGGTGLGLVLSRRIAEKHGGSLELRPRRRGERGAQFALRLPRHPPGQDHNHESAGP